MVQYLIGILVLVYSNISCIHLRQSTAEIWAESAGAVAASGITAAAYGIENISLSVAEAADGGLLLVLSEGFWCAWNVAGSQSSLLDFACVDCGWRVADETCIWGVRGKPLLLFLAMIFWYNTNDVHLPIHITLQDQGKLIYPDMLIIRICLRPLLWLISLKISWTVNI